MERKIGKKTCLPQRLHWGKIKKAGLPQRRRDAKKTKENKTFASWRLGGKTGLSFKLEIPPVEYRKMRDAGF